MGSILGAVLNPSTDSDKVELIKLPFSGHIVYLQQLIPSHFHNVLTVVVVALIGSTMVKGVCDYLGTYLVNYVGFGLITDLRNKFYKNILYRSAGFFSRHTTGTLVSTVINDIDKVQVTFSTVMAEFLLQFFTLIFTVYVVIEKGKQLSLVLLLFVPVLLISVHRIGQRVQIHPAQTPEHITLSLTISTPVLY